MTPMGRYLVLTVFPRVSGFYGDVFRDITPLSYSLGSVLGFVWNLAAKNYRARVEEDSCPTRALEKGFRWNCR